MSYDTHPYLAYALAHNQFRLHYQPIFCLQTNQLVGFEALVRWLTSTGHWISPAEFIPLAEQTGLIIPLGKWILHEACQQLRQWQLNYPSDVALTMSVNISGQQLQQLDFVEMVNQVLQETSLKPAALKLELTETILMEHIDLVQQNLAQLQRQQIEICLDWINGSGRCGTEGIEANRITQDCFSHDVCE